MELTYGRVARFSYLVNRSTKSTGTVRELYVGGNLKLRVDRGISGNRRRLGRFLRAGPDRLDEDVIRSQGFAAAAQAFDASQGDGIFAENPAALDHTPTRSLNAGSMCSARVSVSFT